MILNYKKRGNDYLVSVCDDELLGKTLKDKDIEIHIDKKFYGELKATEDEVIKELKKATIINVIGKESVNTLKKVKKITNIIEIHGIPHAQWIKIL